MQTIKAERLARDLETMMNVVNSDPGHIARAKAKRTRVMRAAAEPKKEAMAPETAILGALSLCIRALRSDPGIPGIRKAASGAGTP